MLRLKASVALISTMLFGCQSSWSNADTVPERAWISWQPHDLSRVAELREDLRTYNRESEDEPFTVTEMIEFDPLSVVPDERFRAAFPQLSDTDNRIDECQMGSTGMNLGTIEFTAHRSSATTVRRKILRCSQDQERRCPSSLIHTRPRQLSEVRADSDDEARRPVKMLASPTKRIQSQGWGRSKAATQNDDRWRNAERPVTAALS